MRILIEVIKKNKRLYIVYKLLWLNDVFVIFRHVFYKILFRGCFKFN